LSPCRAGIKAPADTSPLASTVLSRRPVPRRSPNHRCLFCMPHQSSSFPSLTEVPARRRLGRTASRHPEQRHHPSPPRGRCSSPSATSSSGRADERHQRTEPPSSSFFLSKTRCSFIFLAQVLAGSQAEGPVLCAGPRRPFPSEWVQRPLPCRVAARFPDDVPAPHSGHRCQSAANLLGRATSRSDVRAAPSRLHRPPVPLPSSAQSRAPPCSSSTPHTAAPSLPSSSSSFCTGEPFPVPPRRRCSRPPHLSSVQVSG
jgi:hypothetical protein